MFIRSDTRYINPFGVKHRLIKKKVSKTKLSKPKVKTDEQLAEELNSNANYTWTFRTKNGAVNFKRERFPNCCGIGIVAGVTFGNIREGKREEFYKEIKEYIINDTDNYLNRASILFSDAVGGEHKQKEKNKPHVHEMCQSMGLKESGEMFNPRTGNQLVIFTLTKEVKGIYRQYAETDNGEVIRVG